MTKSERRLAEGMLWLTAEPPRVTLAQRYRKLAPLLVPVLLTAGYFLAQEPARLRQELASQTDALRHELSNQKASTQLFVKLLADAFMGKVIFDKASGTAFFFDKPAAVRLDNNALHINKP